MLCIVLCCRDQEAEEQLAIDYLKQTHPAFANHNNFPDSSLLMLSEQSTVFDSVSDESMHDKESELNSSTEIQLSNYTSTEDNVFKKVNSRRDVIASGAGSEDAQESSLQSSHPSSSEEKNNSEGHQQGQERTEEMSEALAAVMLLTGWPLRSSGHTEAEGILERRDSDTLSIHSSTLGSDDDSVVSGVADFTLLAPEQKEEVLVVQETPLANDRNRKENHGEGAEIMKQFSDETGLVLVEFLHQLSDVSESLSKTIEAGFRRRSITFHSPSASLLVPIKEEAETSPRLAQVDNMGEMVLSKEKGGHRRSSSVHGQDKALDPPQVSQERQDELLRTVPPANEGEGEREGAVYLRKSSLSNGVGLSSEILASSSSGPTTAIGQGSASASSSRESSEYLPTMMDILSMPTTPTIFSVVRGPSFPHILSEEALQEEEGGDRERRERHLLRGRRDRRVVLVHSFLWRGS